MKINAGTKLCLIAMFAMLACLSRGSEVIWMETPPEKPLFRVPPLVQVEQNKLFFWSVPVSGARPMKFSATKLPEGLNINGATGVISGTMPKPGSYRFTVTASNSVGRSSRLIRFVVGPDASAATPPMAWVSGGAYGPSVTEPEVLTNAQVLSAKLAPFGWSTVVLDSGWSDAGLTNSDRASRVGAPLAIDGFGRLLPATNRFPSAAGDAGFSKLSRQVHSLGLRFGIEMMLGIPRVAVRDNLPIFGSKYFARDAVDISRPSARNPGMYGVNANSPAGKAYYNSVLGLYTNWGVDLLRLDDATDPYATNEIALIRTLVKAQKRALVLGLGPGQTPLLAGPYAASGANLWTISASVSDDWNTISNQLALASKWRAFSGPGHWPDTDWLPLGHLSVDGRADGPDRQTRLTRSEQLTAMTFRVIMPSPLAIGATLPDLDAWTLALLTNPEVLDINQDVTGDPAAMFYQPGAQIWVKRLAKKKNLAVALFNTSNVAQDVSVDWKSLKIKGSYTVRDLWLRKNLSHYKDKFQQEIPAHGSMLLLLTPFKEESEK